MPGLILGAAQQPPILTRYKGSELGQPGKELQEIL